MKVCNYCGKSAEDNVNICESCGASDFSHKCPSCGTVYNTGNYCPKCGVQAGTKPKTCPKCGKEYFSNACPNCGYSDLTIVNTGAYAEPAQNYSDSQYSQYNQNTGYTVTQEPVKKRKTWLWVLGWIFIFPLPLTLILIKKDMNPILKYSIIVIAWLLYFGWGAAGGSKTAAAENVPESAARFAVVKTVNTETESSLFYM